MTGSNWYFRNRSRDAIVNMLRVIRFLQLANGFKESEIMRAMAIVWRESGDQTSFATLYLFWMIRELEKDERSKGR